MRFSNVPNLSARDLLAIQAIAEYGSFIAASAFLKVSQPTLSRTVKRVEQVVGIRLFARSTRRVEITAAGREFVAVAERVLSDLQLTLGNLREVADERRGQVIISTFGTFAQEPLPAIIRLYRETRPHVEFRVREGMHPEILEDVCSGVADFGITYVDTSLPETIESVHLRREPMYAIFPAGHPLLTRAKQRTRIALAKLQRAALVSLPNEAYTRRMLDGAAHAAGFSLRHAVTVPRFRDIISYVRAGVGVGIVPSGALVDRPWPECDLRLLGPPSLSVSVGLIVLRARYVTPAAASCMALIRQQVSPIVRARSRQRPTAARRIAS